MLFCVHAWTVIEDHDSDRLYLPPDDIKSINATELLLRRLGLGENERATKPNHFSHDHPLILFDVQPEESESCPGENFKNDDILCEACVKPIFSPFYKCSQCDFILHKCCAELPTELQHPFHPQHPLILLPKYPECWGLFRCQGCRLYCNGFAYGCVECNFYLDVNCGSLPSTIKHEAHRDHLLHMKASQSPGECAACFYEFNSKDFIFGCDTCDFKLHALCSLFPRALRHRYDEHPLILTYSPVEDREADEYYCEICEEEMNPREWFYHCVGCDQSMHPRCALDDKYPNVKFRGILNVDSHRHPLSLARFVIRFEDVRPGFCLVVPIVMEKSMYSWYFYSRI
ncbi:hypothetical protein RJ640_001955 [Escallonia rubra]|uniref:DC1 domain-containing protein n=1 Tax=Escallonia rubra TaxID=112253 RepID=A0AA88U9E3_9ASTE|nr:hypothetical protein RJ640_001955 [Escallonia rubra]